jgi:RNA polymerase sigma-70 factor (ECF subfamily)
VLPRRRGVALWLPGRENRSLFVRAREDRSAFGDVYAANAPALLRYFARRTGDVSDSYDLMAETFAELFARIEHFDGTTDAEGRAWMWSVARSRLYDFYERGRVEKRYLERWGVEPRPLGHEDYERIEEVVDFEGARQLVRDAVQNLAPDDREILWLRIVQEHPFSKVAALLGISEPAARQRESRARRRFLAEIDKLDVPDDEYRRLTAGASEVRT